MLYRDLGRTGYKVSQLGFGGLRLPMIGEGEGRRVNRELAIPMLQRAFAAGVNYVDTSPSYCNKDSQRAIGEGLRGWRDQVILSTKTPEDADEKRWWESLESSLQLLQVEHIDIYNHWGLTWERWVRHVEPRASRWMRQAKDQGLIKHICSSFHDDNEALVKLIDTGYLEAITLQYNMLDRQLEPGMAHAREKGVGIVVMGPVAGGRLGVSSPVLEELIPNVKRVPELALRFVLANPNVCVALSGMGTMQQVEENLATASDPVSLSAEDTALIAAQLERLSHSADLYCTGCGYCLPCPQEVNIPEIFRRYNEARAYGLWEMNGRGYESWAANLGKQADACVECGACEDRCPQRLPIRRRLEEAHRALSKKSWPNSSRSGRGA